MPNTLIDVDECILHSNASKVVAQAINFWNRLFVIRKRREISLKKRKIIVRFLVGLIRVFFGTTIFKDVVYIAKSFKNNGTELWYILKNSIDVDRHFLMMNLNFKSNNWVL
jgi:hypothetical protein